MDAITAKSVIAFMEKYNRYFTELSAFVSEKRAKVVADDLVWLLDSLNNEQKLVMEGNNLENQRLALFAELGLEGKKSSELVAECPEELAAKLKLECSAMERHVDMIKSTNADIIEIIERKLSIQEKMINKTHATASTYTGKGVKVTKHNTSGGFFGQV